MSNDEPFDPVKIGNSLANLKGLADFVDDGIPVPAHEHDRSVSGDPAERPATPVKPEIKPVSMSTDELLALNATPEGRAKVAEMFGFRNEEVTGPEIIDIPARPEVDALNEAIGGEEGLRNPAIVGEFIREVAAAFGLREAIENGTPEEIYGIAEDGADILSDPEKAKKYVAMLDDPANSALVYKMTHDPYTGRDATNYNFRARQVANNEEPTGRQKPRGDGFVY
jgi:hypothetical protein